MGEAPWPAGASVTRTLHQLWYSPHVTTSDIQLSPRLDSHIASHIGLHRELNEDAFRSTPARGIFVIADGMGGHPAGEVASSLAVEACHTMLARGARMADAFAAAQYAVLDAVKRDPRKRGMGTTLVAATITRDGLTIAWTGDSRCYRYRQGILQLLTEDHGQSGYITQYIGNPEGAVIGLEKRSLQTSDKILLCSDGLSSYVSEELIRKRMQAGKSAKQIVSALIQDSLDEGGQDNVTCAVVRVTR